MPDKIAFLGNRFLVLSIIFRKVLIKQPHFMTALLGFLLSISLILPQVSGSLPKKLGAADIPKAVVKYHSALTPDATFSIDNETALALGSVTVHQSGGSNSYISVPTYGTFTTSLSDTPVLCFINGQSFVEGVPTRIMITSHLRVLATWTSSIVVINEEEEL